MAASSDLVREAIQDLERMIGQLTQAREQMIDRFNHLHEMEVQTAGLAESQRPTNEPAAGQPVPAPPDPMAHVGEGNAAPDNPRPSAQPEDHPKDDHFDIDKPPAG